MKHSIPNTLSEGRWVCWKGDKAPRDLRGRTCDVTRTSFSLGEARAAVEARHVDGLGFVFDGRGIIGIDLDGCIDEEGNLAADARHILDKLGSFTELSKSKRGLHIYVRGTLPPGRRRTSKGMSFKGLEVYDRDRFFVFTGEKFGDGPDEVVENQPAIDWLFGRYFAEPETPRDARPRSASFGSPLMSDAEILERAANASNGSKFRELFAGGDAGHKSDSEADLALARQLAFWSQDRAQLESLLRQSGRARAKWDESRGSSSYLRKYVIDPALHDLRERYSPLGDDLSERARAMADDVTPAPWMQTPDGPISIAIPEAEAREWRKVKLVLTDAARVRGAIELTWDATYGDTTVPIILRPSERSGSDAAKAIRELVEAGGGAVSKRDVPRLRTWIRSLSAPGEAKLLLSRHAARMDAIAKAETLAGGSPPTPTMIANLIEFIRARWDARFVLGEHAWSEKLGELVKITRITNHKSAGAREAVLRGSDWDPQRARTHEEAARVLGVLMAAAWADVVEMIPNTLVGAAKALGPNSKAARALKDQLVEALMHDRDVVVTIQKEATDGTKTTVVQRASMMARLASYFALLDMPEPGRWSRGHPDSEVWLQIDDDRRVWLALRYGAVAGVQGRKKPLLASISNQRQFARVLHEFGLVHDGPDGPTQQAGSVRVESGTSRAMLLSRAIANKLLDKNANWRGELAPDLPI
ncbi:MAG: hypothetical protein KDA20_00240 [Phycisphaerales bacterium]|nr:hypothetical protein [Phycisphaerales bacterium]